MNDNDTIIKTVLDYGQGWYRGDAERMDQALSKHLAKRRISPDEEIIDLPKEWMITETGNGKGRIPNPEQGRNDLTFFDQTVGINLIPSIKSSCCPIARRKCIKFIKHGDTRCSAKFTIVLC